MSAPLLRLMGSARIASTTIPAWIGLPLRLMVLVSRVGLPLRLMPLVGRVGLALRPLVGRCEISRVGVPVAIALP
jgi:hypothetical protein